MIKEFKHVYVDTLPHRDNMEEGFVYVSDRTWQASHLDAHGTGEEIITPLVRGGWRYFVDENEKISLHPAVFSETAGKSYSITQGYAIL